MPQNEKLAAPNFEAIQNWVDQYRPDLSDMVRQILSHDSEQGQAIQSLAAMAFCAGRHYQKAHFELDPNFEFHR